MNDKSLARHALVLVGDEPVARTLAAHSINLPVLPSVVVTSISALWPTVGVVASDQVFDTASDSPICARVESGTVDSDPAPKRYGTRDRDTGLAADTRGDNEY